jgi:hypothetical protein
MRSILAILAGIVVLTLASFAIEAVANPLLMRIFPQSLPNSAALLQNIPVKLFTFAYSTLCVAAGAYVTALIARHSPTRHALIMGAIQTALTVWAMLAIPDHAPRWIWIIGIATVLPAAWLGGHIRENQTTTHYY